MIWGNDYWTGWTSSMGSGGMIMMLAFWVLITGGVFMLYRWLSGWNKKKFSNRLTASVDILQRRCAGREINRDELVRVKEDL